LDPVRTDEPFAPGDSYRIEIIDRLDLFAAEVLERAWLTLPEPRRAVLDLRATTEVTLHGAAVLVRLCEPSSEGGAATILLPSKEGGWGAPLAGVRNVYETAAEAVGALGPIPESSRSPITVTVRPRNLPS